VKLLNPWELLLIVFVLVLIFGSKRLPGMGRSMGGAIKGFKDSVTERTEKHDAEHEQEQLTKQQAELPPAPPVAPQAQQPVEADPRERDTVV
jgi:sec-independent protein translocase protein TatA